MKSFLAFVVAAALLVGVGCQRSLGTGTASGPFAPAGTSAVPSTSPLIPLSPITGATRVPPPSTGSSSAANGYLGTPTALAPTSFADPASMQANNDPITGFRSSLGGMKINDFTAQVSPSPGPYAESSYIASAPGQPIGSGVYPSGPSSVPNANSLPKNQVVAGQPADLMRPIDPGYVNQPFVSSPSPQYRGITSSPVQPAVGYAGNDAWQTVQPATSSQFSSRPSPATTVPGGPSTEPVVPYQPSAQTANQSLPWRSPTTAR